VPNDTNFSYSETLYSPEELLGMLLHRAREFAQDSAHQPINEAVLTVPGFFNQAERRSLLKAAELAGLRVLQLMNDYTAGKFSIWCGWTPTYEHNTYL
jgi:hypoxia up-regulated 1